jgi:hypothetical protein
MNRFGYWRDPLFLAAVSGYGLNRWLIKPLGPPPFRHGYWADLLMIPAALPLVLWLQRLSGLRPHDQSPSGSEIALHLAGWSVICEFVGPQWGHHGMGCSGVRRRRSCGVPLVESFRATSLPPHRMSFDTLAPYYRNLEFALAGGLPQRCRTAFLAAAADSRRAVLLGNGPGRFLGGTLANESARRRDLRRAQRTHDRRGPKTTHAIRTRPRQIRARGRADLTGAAPRV